MTSADRHVFGPVPSRRLGISLGIDIIPYKACSLDCLYCECGQTTQLLLERKHFVAPAEVLAELAAILPTIPHLDVITFSGSGEPTLNADLGELIRGIKNMTRVPVVVLTNGTLCHRADVRHDLRAADIVLPSLDAATPAVFRQINRPHPGLEVEPMVAGLAAFRQEYRGQIWLEVFILKGINDTAAERAALHAAIARIAPDRVQLNTLDRPPAVPGIESAPIALLEEIAAEWSDLPVEIIKRFHHRGEILAFSQNLENSILNTIRRRPLTVADLAVLTGKGNREILKYLDVLEKERQVRRVIVGKDIFYALPATP
ncbi:MAG TPA: radical SAM protein [Candidatus Aminicenantes bacterium]|nr:radical SAM protein [Candidatus Aminicenantes bacterium]